MENEEVQTGNPIRNNAVNEIIENAKKGRGEPEELTAEQAAAAVDEVVEKEDGDQWEENASDTVETNEQEEENQQDHLVTIVVDGVEQQVPASKVYEHGIRTLQKESAADKRLAEASHRVRQAAEYEQRVRAQVEARLRAAQQQQNDGAPLSKKQDVDVRAKARQIIDKILDGDEDEAAEALAEAMGRQQATPQIDPQRLVQETTRQVQRSLEQQTAIERFRQDYSHIANDANLWNMTDQETIRVAKEHPDWGPSQVIAEAASRVDNWVRSVAGGPRQSETPAPEGKQERKRTKETLKPANARQAPPKEKKPATRSEIVAEMRKRRGLPAY